MASEGLQGHRARKRFGQNFLHDRHWIERIAKAVNATAVSYTHLTLPTTERV